jgi:hemerythrin
MQRIEWTEELELGIPVIDKQHQRIVDTINTLADEDTVIDEATLNSVINGLIDYTYSHFAFEETLMEEAGYEFLQVHQQTHQAFTRRVEELNALTKQGEDVTEKIASMLQSWLINHIMEEDRNYAPYVKKMMPGLEKRDSGNWLKSTLKRFFG